MTSSVTMFSAFLYLLYFSTLRVVLFLLQYSVHVHATVYLLLKKQEKKNKKSILKLAEIEYHPNVYLLSHF